MLLLTLKLIAAHFVTRFIVQTDLWARLKSDCDRSDRALLLLGHTCLFMGMAALVAIPGYRSSYLSLPELLGLLISVAVARVVLDMISLLPICARWQGFLAIQTMHICSLVAITSAFGRIPGLSASLLNEFTSPRTYGLLASYAVSLGLGGVLVPLVTGPIVERNEALSQASDTGAKDAGRYIGVLERLLVTTLIIFWPKLDAAAIGFIFSAKSVARLPEFKKQPFAEYYLVGTLTSFMVAIGAGLVARFYFP